MADIIDSPSEIEELHTLAASLSQKLEMMVAKAEADERDQV